MNLHEYQAKELLKKFNVPVQDGIAVSTPHDAEEAYRQIKTTYGSPFAVIKAQIHAGGRGKGKIRETGINGVKVVKSLEPTLDANAIEAVKTWKFEPAMKDGKPVAVQINVEVSFRLY